MVSNLNSSHISTGNPRPSAIDRFYPVGYHLHLRVPINIGLSPTQRVEFRLKFKKLFKWLGIGTGLLTGLIFGLYLIAFKPWLVPSFGQDYFYWGVAVNFSAPEFCEKINWRASYGGYIFADSPSYTRSQCYISVAEKTGNLLLCDRVKELSKYFISGGPTLRGQCLANKIPHPWMVLDQRPLYSLPAYMRPLGVPIERIRKNTEITLSKSDEELYFDYYLKLQNPKDPEQKEFLEAVRRF